MHLIHFLCCYSLSLFLLLSRHGWREIFCAHYNSYIAKQIATNVCPTAEVAAYNIAGVPTTEGSRTRKRFPLSERQFGAALLAAQHGAVVRCAARSATIFPLLFGGGLCFCFSFCAPPFLLYLRRSGG